MVEVESAAGHSLQILAIRIEMAGLDFVIQSIYLGYAAASMRYLHMDEASSLTDSQQRELQSVLREAASLSEAKLWNPTTADQLYARARQAKGEEPPWLYVWEVDRTIRQKQTESVLWEVRGLLKEHDELDDLYLSKESCLRGRRKEMKDWFEAEALYLRLFQLWKRSESDDGDTRLEPIDYRQLSAELAAELETYGMNWSNRMAIEELLAAFLRAFYQEIYNAARGVYWDSLLQEVDKYLRFPRLHSAWVNRFLLLRLIRCLQIPFERTLSGFNRYSIKDRLNLSVIVVVSGGIGGLAGSAGWLYWILWALLATWVLVRVLDLLSAERSLKKLSAIYKELDSGLFDAAEIGRRLREMEQRGLPVPSLTYSLLKVSPTGIPAE